MFKWVVIYPCNDPKKSPFPKENLYEIYDANQTAVNRAIQFILRLQGAEEFKTRHFAIQIR